MKGDVGRAGGGIAAASSGQNYGVYGESDGYFGIGMFGKSNNVAGPNRGVLGVSASPEGVGVSGRADSFTGETTGVYGTSKSSSGRAIRGDATSVTGATFGVYGSRHRTNEHKREHQQAGITIRKIQILRSIAGLVLLGASLGATQSNAQFSIVRSTIDCGGGHSSGGSIELAGTIGQHDAGVTMAGGSFSMSGDFGQAGDGEKPASRSTTRGKSVWINWFGLSNNGRATLNGIAINGIGSGMGDDRKTQFDPWHEIDCRLQCSSR